jgi:hypothetical protein
LSTDAGSRSSPIVRPGFKSGAEALQAFRDLFDSDEEMEEFGDYLQQMREERARYRD